MVSVHFQSKPFNIMKNQVYAPKGIAEEAEWFYEDLKDLLELTPKNDVLFITGLDWKAKVGSQEKPGVTGKFGLGVQNEAGKSLIEICQHNTLVTTNTPSNNTREDSTHGFLQMVNRLIIFFAAKDGEALYIQQKQDRELVNVWQKTLQYCKVISLQLIKIIVKIKFIV